MAEPHVYEQTVRAMIDRENDLFDRRAAFLCTAQGILLTAVALTWDKSDRLLFMGIICVVGAGLSFAIFTTLISAMNAINRLETWWKLNKPSEYDGPGVIGLSSNDWEISQPVWPLRFSQWLFVIAWIIVGAIAWIDHTERGGDQHSANNGDSSRAVTSDLCLPTNNPNKKSVNIPHP
jgi:hypothetical protein